MTDLTGKIFGRLTVVNFSHVVRPDSTHYRRYWNCLCSCGKQKVVVQDSLLSKTRGTKSCGCLYKECSGTRTHGKSGTPEHKVWNGIKKRCLDPNAPVYSKYGGRGITLCERWRDFSNFLADMGPKPSPSHTIERMDNNGAYEPSNCKWADILTQANNKRNNVLVSTGETLAQFARRKGVKYKAFHKLHRVKGYDIEEAARRSPKVKKSVTV